MDGYLATFEPHSDATELHEHWGAEFIYVISGSLDLTIDNETITLDEGDSMYFDPSLPHSYCQKSKHTCRAVVVVTS